MKVVLIKRIRFQDRGNVSHDVDHYVSLQSLKVHMAIGPHVSDMIRLRVKEFYQLDGAKHL